MAYRSLSKLMSSNISVGRLHHIRLPIYILERMLETGVEIEPTPESTLVYTRNIGLPMIPPSKLEACGKLYRTSIIHQYQMATEKLFETIAGSVFNAGDDNDQGIECIPILKTVYPRLQECCLLDVPPKSIDSTIDGFYGTSKTMYFYGRDPIRHTMMIDEWKRNELQQIDDFTMLSKSEIDGLGVFSKMFYSRNFIHTKQPNTTQTVVPKKLDEKVGFALKLKLVLGVLYNIDLYRIIGNEWADCRNSVSSPEEFINQSIKLSREMNRLSHMTNELINFPEETAFLMSPFRTYDTMYTWQKRRADTDLRKFRPNPSDNKGKLLLLYIWYYLWLGQGRTNCLDHGDSPAIAMES